MTRDAKVRLARLVRAFPSVRVLVLGDLMLDRFIWGRVRRISPEAPVPVVHVTAEDARPGGAGNVASNVAALGGRVAVAGVVGQDAAGRRLLAALHAIGARTEGVCRTRRAETTQKTRIIAHQQQLVRLDREHSGPLDPRATARVRRWVLEHVRRFDVLVASDYGKGVIDRTLLEALAATHERRPFTWLVDPKHSNFPHYRRASLVKPNLAEAGAAAGIDIVDGRSLRQAGRHLLQRWQAEAILISRGEEGMTLFRRGAPMRTFPTVARSVFDVTGAGDTVVATCALALAAGGTLEDATILANEAAGLAVGKVGTVPVEAQELLRAVKKQ